MCHSWADRHRRGDDEAGFSLVEVVVAMVIFMVVALATAPLLVGGLKAGRTSQLNLQAKALGQERLELMRNLPFHVARQNGQYLDLLDIYFRDTVPVGALAPAPAVDTCAARTFTAATSTYSCLITGLGADYAGFRQLVTTQFLKADRSVVPPRVGYSSQITGQDLPESNLLGVTVTTSWTQAGRAQQFTVRSLVANAQAGDSVISASLRTSALDVTSNLPSGDVLQFEGGLISAEGSLTTGSSAALSAVPARAGLASGASSSGVSLALRAPPAVVGTSPSDSSLHYLDGLTCTLVCFEHTAISGDQEVTVASGRPRISTLSNPVTTVLRRASGSPLRGLSYRNATIPEAPALELTGPLVSAGAGVTAEVLSARGAVDATGGGSSAVRAAGSVRLPRLELFPTLFAPQGVVQVELDDATMTCQSGGGAPAAASATWSGRVRYWSSSAAAYVTLPLAPGAPALPSPTSLLVQPGKPLSTWVQSWSALTDDSSVNETSGRRGKATLAAVLSILTAETRAADPTSPVNVTVGSLSCLAEDLR